MRVWGIQKRRGNLVPGAPVPSWGGACCGIVLLVAVLLSVQQEPTRAAALDSAPDVAAKSAPVAAPDSSQAETTESAPAVPPKSALAPPSRQVFQQDVAWSPDGRWLAFSEYDGRQPFDAAGWGVFVVAADGTGRRLLQGGAVGVTWSPDGKRLAFASSRDGNSEIYTIAVDGTDLQRLTRDPAKDHQPAWSPRGGRIAFCSDRDGSVDIHTMAVDGSGLRRLTRDPAKDLHPAWSHDGALLVFYRDRGDGMDQIHLLQVESGVERAITADEANNIYPSFCPNGDIVFASKSHEATTILVRVDPGGGHRRLLGDWESFFARVAPDGRIAFIAGKWPRSAIYVQSDGTVEKRVN